MEPLFTVLMMAAFMGCFWYLYRLEQRKILDNVRAIAAEMEARGLHCSVRGKEIYWEDGGLHRLTVFLAKIDNRRRHVVKITCTVPARGLPPMKLMPRPWSPVVNLFTGTSRSVGDAEFDQAWKLTSSAGSAAIRLLQRTDRFELVRNMTGSKTRFEIRNERLCYRIQYEQQDTDVRDRALEAIAVALRLVRHLRDSRGQNRRMGRITDGDRNDVG